MVIFIATRSAAKGATPPAQAALKARLRQQRDARQGGRPSEPKNITGQEFLTNQIAKMQALERAREMGDAHTEALLSWERHQGPEQAERVQRIFVRFPDANPRDPFGIVNRAHADVNRINTVGRMGFVLGKHTHGEKLAIMQATKAVMKNPEKARGLTWSEVSSAMQRALRDPETRLKLQRNARERIMKLHLASGVPLGEVRVNVSDDLKAYDRRVAAIREGRLKPDFILSSKGAGGSVDPAELKPGWEKKRW